MHITAHLDVDVVAVEADDEVTVLFELEAPVPPASAPRKGQTLVVVLDRSGSMTRGPLEGAKRALDALVTRLHPDDRFGLVVFDDSADVVVPTRTMADHDRATVRRLIAQIEPGGCTDLSAGYLLGLREAGVGMGDTGATVLVVSDGHANEGETSPERLGPVAASHARRGITTATLGYGLGYDEVLLAALSRDGGGEHRFAQDVDEAGAAIAAEVDGLLAKSAVNVQAVLPYGQHVRSYRLYGELPAWRQGEALVVQLGDMYTSESRSLLVRMTVPGMAALGLCEITQVVLTYTALPDLNEVTVTVPVAVNVVPADVAAGRVRDPRVRVEQLVMDGQSAKVQAAAALREGRRDDAAELLRSVQAQLREEVSSLGELPPEAVERADEELASLEELAVSAEQEDTLLAAKRAHFVHSVGSRGRKAARRILDVDVDDDSGEAGTVSESA